jgi:hypothetical protein
MQASARASSATPSNATLKSRLRLQVLFLQFHPSRGWYLLMDYWYLLMDYWYLLMDYWYLLMDYWYLLMDYWYLLMDYIGVAHQLLALKQVLVVADGW